MLSLEEYIHKRKTEDGINEKDKDKRLENMQICTNYIFEYFHQYLDTIPEDPKTILHTQRVEKYRDQLANYTPEIREGEIIPTFCPAFSAISSSLIVCVAIQILCDRKLQICL